MRRLAMRVGLLAVTGLMLVGVPLSLAPAAAQAQSFYVQVGPRYGSAPGYPYRQARSCRAAYWHRDWQAMRWCRFHGYSFHGY